MKIPDHAIVHEGVVPFHDCDPLGIVWHGNYYKYLEIARTKLLGQVDLDVEDFRRMGYGLLVIETRCRHAYPLRFGERYRVRAFCIDYEQRLHLGYQVDNLDAERRAARAWTTLVTTRNGVMLLETPHEIQKQIRRIL